MIKRLGRYTIEFEGRPKITGYSSVVGATEGAGPLGKNFDRVIFDAYAGQLTFEKAECLFQQEALSGALNRAGRKAEETDFVFAGDLLNQCISSSYGVKDFGIPYLGQYGACSTMAQTMIMAALAIEGGAARSAACVTSSHFCTAERQYRTPLEYGGQRTPTAQRTVTGAGSVVVEKSGTSPCILRAAVGKIFDAGVKDLSNMGAAMAPAAAETIKMYFEDTATEAADYDLVLTGDLGLVGSSCLYELLERDGYNIRKKHNDCGLMIFDRKSQDVHAGGSGCGCCAAVLCSTILPKLEKGELKNILFIATGALMSPTSSLQGQSIPAVAHLLNIRA